jgi:hypothetical protein
MLSKFGGPHMLSVLTICLVVTFILFVLAAVGVAVPRLNLMAAGLAMLTLSMLI